MVAVLDHLGLTELVMTIAGLTPVAAAAILAETGDPNRFARVRCAKRRACSHHTLTCIGMRPGR
jgi:transposase